MLQIRRYRISTGDISDVGMPRCKTQTVAVEAAVTVLNAGACHDTFYYYTITPHRTRHDWPVGQDLVRLS